MSMFCIIADLHKFDTLELCFSGDPLIASTVCFEKMHLYLVGRQFCQHENHLIKTTGMGLLDG